MKKNIYYLIIILLIVIGCGRRGQEFYNQGVEKYTSKDFEGAIICFSRIIEIDSSRADAYNYRGLSELCLEDIPVAYADFKRAVRHNPEFAEAYYNIGYLRQKQLELGIAFVSEIKPLYEFDKAIEIEPNNAKYYFARGWTNSLLLNHREAISNYTKAIELDSSFAIAYVKRGYEVSIEFNNHAEAILDFDKAIKIDNKISEAYLNRGISKISLNDNEGGLTDFTKAISNSKESEYEYYSAHFYRGTVKSALRDEIGAINDFRAIVDIDYSKIPDLSKGFRHFNANRLEELKEEAIYRRGRSKFNLKDYRGALLDLERRIVNKPMDGDAYHIRGRIKLAFNDLKGAIMDLSKAIDLDSNIASAYFFRGLIYLDNGNKEKGCKDMSKAGELGLSQAYDIIYEKCR